LQNTSLNVRDKEEKLQPLSHVLFARSLLAGMLIAIVLISTIVSVGISKMQILKRLI
jgi:hypothetical protein